MPLLGNALISEALKRSLKKKTKNKGRQTTLDESIYAHAKRIAETKIEFRLINDNSLKVDQELKKKYILLKPESAKNNVPQKISKREKLREKRKKRRLRKKKFKKKCESSAESWTMRSPQQEVNDKSELPRLPSPAVVLFDPEQVQVGWQSNVPVGSGFVNYGTTCYINSTLQALFHIPSFVNWLCEDKQHTYLCEKKNGAFHNDCVLCAVSKTLLQAQKATGTAIRPKQVLDKIKIICKHLSSMRQEDAHEFLRYLVEAMEKSYLSALHMYKQLDNYSKETTPLNQIFGGYIRTEVTCLECRYMSTTFQHFQDLILDIRQSSSVSDALENFFATEKLDVDDGAYQCDKCKKRVPAYKKYSIEKAPRVLCIQLKRFNIHSFYGGGKLSKQITVQPHLDLIKFRTKMVPAKEGSLSYRLVSMVFHHGASANSGHYTALGSCSTGGYYYFNDEHVQPTSLNGYIQNSNAYIIFYEQDTSCFQSKMSHRNQTFTTATNGFHSGKSQFQSSAISSARPVSPVVPSGNKSHYKLFAQKEPLKITLNRIGEKSSITIVPNQSTTFVKVSSSDSIPNNRTKSDDSDLKSLVPYTPDSSDEDSETKSTNSNGSTNVKIDSNQKCSILIATLQSPPLNKLSKDPRLNRSLTPTKFEKSQINSTIRERENSAGSLSRKLENDFENMKRKEAELKMSGDQKELKYKIDISKISLQSCTISAIPKGSSPAVENKEENARNEDSGGYKTKESQKEQSVTRKLFYGRTNGQLMISDDSDDDISSSDVATDEKSDEQCLETAEQMKDRLPETDVTSSRGNDDQRVPDAGVGLADSSSCPDFPLYKNNTQDLNSGSENSSKNYCKTPANNVIPRKNSSDTTIRGYSSPLSGLFQNSAKNVRRYDATPNKNVRNYNSTPSKNGSCDQSLVKTDQIQNGECDYNQNYRNIDQRVNRNGLDNDQKNQIFDKNNQNFHKDQIFNQNHHTWILNKNDENYHTPCKSDQNCGQTPNKNTYDQISNKNDPRYNHNVQHSDQTPSKNNSRYDHTNQHFHQTPNKNLVYNGTPNGVLSMGHSAPPVYRHFDGAQNSQNSNPLQNPYYNGIPGYNSMTPLNGTMNVSNGEYSTQYVNGYTNGYYSHHGYGARVLTWNGEISYISQETEIEKVENGKRSYNDVYNDDMDRGKVKKQKFPTPSGQNAVRPNNIQEYQNRINKYRKHWRGGRNRFTKNPNKQNGGQANRYSDSFNGKMPNDNRFRGCNSNSNVNGDKFNGNNSKMRFNNKAASNCSNNRFNNISNRYFKFNRPPPFNPQIHWK